MQKLLIIRKIIQKSNSKKKEKYIPHKIKLENKQILKLKSQLHQRKLIR